MGDERETDQEEHDRKQSELDAERAEHMRRRAGGDPEK